VGDICGEGAGAKSCASFCSTPLLRGREAVSERWRREAILERVAGRRDLRVRRQRVGVRCLAALRQRQKTAAPQRMRSREGAIGRVNAAAADPPKVRS